LYFAKIKYTILQQIVVNIDTNLDVLAVGADKPFEFISFCIRLLLLGSSKSLLFKGTLSLSKLSV
jgi:hypothetical protein